MFEKQLAAFDASPNFHQGYAILHREAEKRNQLIFVCKFVKNQRILTQFSLLDFKMNDTFDGMNFTHLT